MINNILVYLDEEDLEEYKKVSDAYDLFRKNEIDGLKYKGIYNNFYAYALNKYGVLKNKQWYIEPIQGFIKEYLK